MSEIIDVSGLLKQGWTLQDFPQQVPAVWELLKEGLPEGEHHVLAEAHRYSEHYGESRRGQILMSPVCRAALGDFYRANKHRFTAAFDEHNLDEIRRLGT